MGKSLVRWWSNISDLYVIKQNKEGMKAIFRKDNSKKNLTGWKMDFTDLLYTLWARG